ncbi:DUF4886 domain-containing protein [Parapedobacter sp. SGR-10]|uniref:DUF4886 domain-containing protein n=1 Tax=Parapedobacter sp. SGR-10 TaxID=2710879 RepID=UPI0013D61747|nr:DUF4886 domain-containing protein [Parapedobacter sp. SGR-10]NGF57980.1 DUF4886 domain-containing protein [Parapedobacter sp. SGR-10]
MKKHIYTRLLLLFGILAGTLTFSSCQKMDRPAMGEIIPDPEDDGSIRVLAIGNSFSTDALETHLSGLAQAAGIPMTIGNLHIDGASLELHRNNVQQNANTYSYRKIDRNGEKTTTGGFSIHRALADENWTHVSFQQVSQNSGQYETWAASLPFVYEYVAPRAKNPTVKFLLHQTWAYAQTSTHSGFANYSNNQMTMYSAIVDAVNRAKDLVAIDAIVPAGTAIQNVRTSIIGDNVTSDGYHLNAGIGRYTAACVWFEVLTGQSVLGNTYVPAGMSAYEAEIAQQAAHMAMAQPSSVTDMVDYKDWGGSFEFVDPIYLDFGQNVATDGWNGITVSDNNVGFSISNLRDENGEFTGISYTMLEKFNGVNTNGVPFVGSTPFSIPESVARRSFFGHALDWGTTPAYEKGVFKLYGLDPEKSYELCYYASREGGDVNVRETAFIAEGANTSTVSVLTSTTPPAHPPVVCSPNAITPNSNGEITITVTAGANNTHVNKFFYINAMRIQPSN